MGHRVTAVAALVERCDVARRRGDGRCLVWLIVAGALVLKISPTMLPIACFCRYFSIAVQDNATDLLLSLDAQYGDPDM